MSVKGSISSHKAGKGKLNILHDNREQTDEKGNPVYPWNAHESKKDDNKILKREELVEAYEKCYGDAVTRYNVNKKPSRKIQYEKISDFKGNENPMPNARGLAYFEHLFKTTPKSTVVENPNRNKHREQSFYGEFTQVGRHSHYADKTLTDIDKLDKDGNPVLDDDGKVIKMTVGERNIELAVEALEEYYYGFVERNPNLYVFNAVIHCDEIEPMFDADGKCIKKGGSPHLQQCLLAVAHNKEIKDDKGKVIKRRHGLDTYNGYDQAMTEMGYGGKEGFKRWRAKERDIFREICKTKEFSFEIKEREEELLGGRVAHGGKDYLCDEYKEIMEEAEEKASKIIEEAEKIKENAKKEAKEIVEDAQYETIVIEGFTFQDGEMEKLRAKKKADALIEEAENIKAEALEMQAAYEAALNQIDTDRAALELERIVFEEEKEAVKKRSTTIIEEAEEEAKKIKENVVAEAAENVEKELNILKATLVAKYIKKVEKLREIYKEKQEEFKKERLEIDKLAETTLQDANDEYNKSVSLREAAEKEKTAADADRKTAKDELNFIITLKDNILNDCEGIKDIIVKQKIKEEMEKNPFFKKAKDAAANARQSEKSAVHNPQKEKLDISSIISAPENENPEQEV